MTYFEFQDMRDENERLRTTPSLGLATTKELLDELAARLETQPVVQNSQLVLLRSVTDALEWLPANMLAYRTVDA